MPDDPFSDDPFFSGDFLDDDEEKVNAFELAQQADWLREHGYFPGDEIELTWRDSDGSVTQTSIELPSGDWDDPGEWSDFYDEMREFYEDIWGDDEGYSGEATAG